MRAKYKIWDNEKECWYKPIYNVWKGELHDLTLTQSGELMLRDMNGTTHESSFPGRYEVVMFTGLTDKNGVDLDWWEGDILQLQDKEDKSICVIVWRNGGFMKQYYTDGKPSLDDDTGREWFARIDYLDKNGLFKKIGDIHQDKNLLK